MDGMVIDEEGEFDIDTDITLSYGVRETKINGHKKSEIHDNSGFKWITKDLNYEKKSLVIHLNPDLS